MTDCCFADVQFSNKQIPSTQTEFSQHMKTVDLCEKQSKSVCCVFPLCDGPVQRGRNFTNHLSEIRNLKDDTEELELNSVRGTNSLCLIFSKRTSYIS